eukprot:754757-Hanusia_phi.AAC.3
MDVEASRIKQESMDIRLKTSLMKGAFAKQTDMRADLFHRVLSSGKEIASTDIQESGLRSVAAEQVERGKDARSPVTSSQISLRCCRM